MWRDVFVVPPLHARTVPGVPGLGVSLHPIIRAVVGCVVEAPVGLGADVALKRQLSHGLTVEPASAVAVQDMDRSSVQGDAVVRACSLYFARAEVVDRTERTHAFQRMEPRLACTVCLCFTPG